VSRTGDLWLLGQHRLLCGDSAVATDVERVLGGVQPHLMVTDPPYPLLISGVRLRGHDRLGRHDALTAEKLNFSAGTMTTMVSETASAGSLRI